MAEDSGASLDYMGRANCASAVVYAVVSELQGRQTASENDDGPVLGRLLLQKYPRAVRAACRQTQPSRVEVMPLEQFEGFHMLISHDWEDAGLRNTKTQVEDFIESIFISFRTHNLLNHPGM